MSRTKPIILCLLILSFVLAITVIQLNLPTQARAGPLAGFTPTPTTPDGGGGGGGGDSDSDDDESNEPDDSVVVKIDRCDLSCSVGAGQGGDAISFANIAPVEGARVEQPLLDPAPELLTQVKLVHDGSGFIVEGVLSDRQSTRFAVPYPGRWEVFLTAAPQFVTAETMDTSLMNLAQLQAELSHSPVSLGFVEANAVEVQYVKCPLNCVIEAEPLPVAEPPLILPVTGTTPNDDGGALITFLIISGSGLATVGLTFLLTAHSRPKR